MRTIKEPEIRKNEILDAAEKLFAVKGFEKATVNDILEETGIAKGTFYYYFKSKEDALDAIIKRRIDGFMVKVKVIAADSELEVPAKLLSIIMALKPQNPEGNKANYRLRRSRSLARRNIPAQEGLILVLHEQGNAQFHQKSLTESVMHLTPVLRDIVEEGNKQGIFNTPYPKESIELLLTAAMVLFDDGFFQWPPAEMAVKIPAFICAMERILGAKPGSLAVFTKVF
ncbi:MAG: TetR/AcrR family transcriptional regulator [Treponema sp.]|nr:TetR/AcrR family transcriptional regulator [Treponema sp.]